MKLRFLASALTCCFVFALTLGCDGSVETTDDSTKIELEGPTVETGDDPIDLDPSTDGDIDIDTPAKGDS